MVNGIPAVQRDRIGIVDQPVEHGLRDRRIPEKRVPVAAGQLPGDDGRGQAIAVLHDFEEILTLDFRERAESPFIGDQAVEAPEPGEQRRVSAVGAREGEFLEASEGRMSIRGQVTQMPVSRRTGSHSADGSTTHFCRSERSTLRREWGSQSRDCSRSDP